MLVNGYKSSIIQFQLWINSGNLMYNMMTVYLTFTWPLPALWAKCQGHRMSTLQSLSLKNTQAGGVEGRQACKQIIKVQCRKNSGGTVDKEHRKKWLIHPRRCLTEGPLFKTNLERWAQQIIWAVGQVWGSKSGQERNHVPKESRIFWERKSDESKRYGDFLLMTEELLKGYTQVRHSQICFIDASWKQCGG